VVLLCPSIPPLSKRKRKYKILLVNKRERKKRIKKKIKKKVEKKMKKKTILAYIHVHRHPHHFYPSLNWQVV
jgi:hypothetical protein